MWSFPRFAAEAQDVEPLGWYDGADGSTHPVHEALHREVLVDVEVVDEGSLVPEGATSV